MKLLIVRHGDPDYSIDSLPPKGWHEAELLKNRLTKLDVAAFYCSPLGRAKDTSKATLNALGRTAEIFDWLREFDGYVIDPESGERTYSWDRTPAFLSENDDYYDKDKWISTPFYSSGDVPEKYKTVCDGIDELLARHGYVHDGKIYRVERENSDTVVLFCHFGVECVLLSHILKISPVVLWHNFVALPTSVTTLITEEREQGKPFSDATHSAISRTSMQAMNPRRSRRASARPIQILTRDTEKQKITAPFQFSETVLSFVLPRGYFLSTTAMSLMRSSLPVTR